jgi:hypothetical protein
VIQWYGVKGVLSIPCWIERHCLDLTEVADNNAFLKLRRKLLYTRSFLFIVNNRSPTLKRKSILKRMEAGHVESRQRPQIVVDQEEIEKMRQWYLNLAGTQLYISDEYHKRKQENGFHDAEGVNDMFKTVSSVIQKIRDEHTRQMKLFRECRVELLDRRKNEAKALAKYKGEIDEKYQKDLSEAQKINAQLQNALYQTFKETILQNANMKLQSSFQNFAASSCLGEYVFHFMMCVPNFPSMRLIPKFVAKGLYTLFVSDLVFYDNIDMTKMSVFTLIYNMVALVPNLDKDEKNNATDKCVELFGKQCYTLYQGTNGEQPRVNSVLVSEIKKVCAGCLLVPDPEKQPLGDYIVQNRLIEQEQAQIGEQSKWGNQEDKAEQDDVGYRQRDEEIEGLKMIMNTLQEKTQILKVNTEFVTTQSRILIQNAVALLENTLSLILNNLTGFDFINKEILKQNVIAPAELQYAWSLVQEMVSTMYKTLFSNAHVLFCCKRVTFGFGLQDFRAEFLQEYQNAYNKSTTSLNQMLDVAGNAGQLKEQIIEIERSFVNADDVQTYVRKFYQKCRDMFGNQGQTQFLQLYKAMFIRRIKLAHATYVFRQEEALPETDPYISFFQSSNPENDIDVQNVLYDDSFIQSRYRSILSISEEIQYVLCTFFKNASKTQNVLLRVQDDEKSFKKWYMIAFYVENHGSSFKESINFVRSIDIDSESYTQIMGAYDRNRGQVTMEFDAVQTINATFERNLFVYKDSVLFKPEWDAYIFLEQLWKSLKKTSTT